MANIETSYLKKLTFSLPRNTKLTDEVVQRLNGLLEFAPAAEYRDTLIEIYHQYICKEHDALPINFQDIADQMYFLIEFFKMAEQEMRKNS